jgi:antitoxin (DNA-binding transcriptional repressor) of toxin-antitoxin stability system
MTTRTIELTEATQSLAEYAQQIDDGVIVVTRDGRPIAAVVALPNTDAETITLSQSPQFLALIERSRVRQAQEGGISSADMRQRFSAKPTHE